MPTINLSKKAVEKLIGKSLSLEELKDRISMLGTDLENVEEMRFRWKFFLTDQIC